MGRWLVKKSHKTDICHQVTRRVYQCKIECKTKKLLHKRRGHDKIRYQFKLHTMREWHRGLVGDQKFWLMLTGFFRYPHDKSVKTLGQFLSANFSTSASSWKDKNISICRVHFQLFGHILYFKNS